jgi:hypothetical protein
MSVHPLRQPSAVPLPILTAAQRVYRELEFLLATGEKASNWAPDRLLQTAAQLEEAALQGAAELPTFSPVQQLVVIEILARHVRQAKVYRAAAEQRR